MSNAKEKFYLWSIYLLKEEVSLQEAFNSKYLDVLEEHTVTLTEGDTAQLYLKAAPANTPGWAKALGDSVTPRIGAKAKTVSAAMFIEAGGRTFALTFGFGKSLLATDCWEQEFGLRAVLNMVDEESIRQIELSGFDSLLQNKQAQSVRDANIDEFEIDVDQDVVRSIKGTPKNTNLGRAVSGRDCIHISSRCKAADLRGLLTSLLNESKKEDYLEKFSWISRMKEVRLQELKDELNAELIKRLRLKVIEKSWIAPPEYTQWKDGCAFTYTLGKSQRHDDIHLSEFLTIIESKGKLSDVEIHDLKRWKIEVVDDSGEERDGWPVYRCLYVEVEHEGRTYILNNGGWYEIDNDFFSEVNEVFTNFPVFNGELPPYCDEDEKSYNARVCQENTDLCLMDRKTIELRKRGLTKIEFCDLYGLDGRIIHVKRYSGSSELSHLFAQGIVSAELFAHEPEFRALVNQKLAETHKIEDTDARPAHRQYEVVYGIVSKSQNSLSLPFFSKIMLRNAKRRLEDLGFSVSLAKIASESPDELEPESQGD